MGDEVHRGDLELSVAFDTEVLDDSICDEAIFTIQCKAVPQLLHEILEVCFEDVLEDFA